MAKKKTQAICIRKIDYSETSQVLWFFSPDFGRITAMAKGSKRGTKRKAASPPDLAEVYEILFFPNKNSEMVTLSEFHLLANFPGLRSNLQSYYSTLYMLEVCQRILQPDAEAEYYYSALLESLYSYEQLGQQNMSSKVPLLYFQVQTI